METLPLRRVPFVAQLTIEEDMQATLEVPDGDEDLELDLAGVSGPAATMPAKVADDPERISQALVSGVYLVRVREFESTNPLNVDTLLHIRLIPLRPIRTAR